MSQAGQFSFGTGNPVVEFLSGDAGGLVGPDGLSNIDLLGGNNITTTGNPGANSITFAVTGTTDGAIQIGNGTGSLTSAAVLADGALLIGSTGIAPVAATLTPGANISITNAAGSITITGTGSTIEWNEDVGPAVAMAVENGYIANNAGLVTLTLPVAAAVGERVGIVGKGAGGWLMAQNAGQTVHIIGSDTTTGVGGSLASTAQYDSLEAICITANTDWVIRSSMGNLTIV